MPTNKILYVILSLSVVFIALRANAQESGISRNDNGKDCFRDGLQCIVDKNAIEKRLKAYIASRDAHVGVAVIVNGKDTVGVNGSEYFPMMSVFKFPQSLAVADFCLKNNVGLSDSVKIDADEIKENTWSPMREKYGVRNLKLPLSELLDYTLQQSDNNACDILFRFIGGTSVADSLMKSSGFDDIQISQTEDDMHREPDLCYLNRTTPMEMARLFDRFYRQEMRHDSQIHEFIAASMMSCCTGLDRLPAPLKHSDAQIGHKTGTGDMNSQGRIMAINDAGYVFLSNNTGYAIAVFVADSAYGMAETSKIIADISDIVFMALSE
ncbi:MAG: class A beta-lactamase [Muribaculaceae bacterium]|nr:class A beta-lactamase [Muribaculaceae bacterium]